MIWGGGYDFRIFIHKKSQFLGFLQKLLKNKKLIIKEPLIPGILKKNFKESVGFI
jgi:hypothetical protein